MSKMKRRAQFQARPFFSCQNSVVDVHRVLQMRKKDALLEHEIANVILPNRKSILEPEFAKKICAMHVELTAGAFFIIERYNILSNEYQVFRTVIKYMTSHVTV